MSTYNNKFKIGNKYIGDRFPTYFIADIASNHDQNLNRAKDLIYLAKEAGADAVKLQHFEASTLVSDTEFRSLKLKSHQSKWKKSVYETYKQNELLFEWTEELYKISKKIKIDFFTAAYSENLVDRVNRFIPAYKIGSGDITYSDILKNIAKKNKPIFLATGAASAQEVDLAVKTIRKKNKKLCLMQCNTNYTGSKKNLNFINLNVLNYYKKKYNLIIGLSDHTHGHTTVLGAVALGARAVEKHFTDNNSRIGPDHSFSMNKNTWSDMVQATRELESSLGSGVKKIEENEKVTSILQRRSIILSKNINKDSKISKSDLVFLRPNVPGGFQPYEASKVIGKIINKKKKRGQALLKKDIK